jgi:type VI secretion system protein ImpJ
MKPIQRVVWSEGMFLSPQHLQQLDAYHEELLQTRLSAAGTHQWGVVWSELSREAMGTGQVQLERFFAILPEGLTLRFERNDLEAPPARPVDPHFSPGQRTLEVFVGVPKERLDAAPGPDGAATNVRYALAQRPIADLFPANPTSTSPVKSVTFAQRRVQLLFGNEPREDFECIKIAELSRDAMGALVQEAGYVPPCLRLDAAPFVIEGLRKLLGQMAAKQRVLADARRAREASSVEFTPSDVTRYLHLRALNVALPVLNHLVDSGDAHPHLAYLWLLQMAGELMTFSAQVDPLSLPKFRFTELGPTFASLFDRLNELLRALAAELSLAVPLEMRPGGLYVGKLEDERISRCGQFILGVKSELPEQQVSEQVPRLAKIASITDIQRIVQAAAPGVPLLATFRPPPEISARPGVIYFALSVQDAYWKNAVRDRAVAIYLPQPFDPSRTKIELLGVPGAAA